MISKEYDVFVSHASKDKKKYVDGLVDALKKEGLSVFYDTECISWGEHSSAIIEEGLQNCKRAIVVISKNFFGRSWTEHELRTLLHRQNKEGKKIILPILYNITKKELIQHYPELSDIQYKHSKSCKCEVMARIIASELK
ncbi:TIR domain-containing protein [Ruminococcaceae bacterium YAD3003]|nr:TIR domain-containing protein [Ruminococcaceae bacterium YAD3003]